MSQSRNPLALVIGAAVATGALAGPLFSMDAMAHGYLQDPPKAAASEGKCGEGKCGAGMMGADKPAKADKAMHEGSCGMAQKDTDKDGRIHAPSSPPPTAARTRCSRRSTPTATASSARPKWMRTTPP